MDFKLTTSHTWTTEKQPQPFSILGKWSLDLDQYFDIESLDAIYDATAKGVAKSVRYFEPVVIGSKDAQFDETLSEVSMYMQEHLKEDGTLDRLTAEGMTKRQIYDYVKYRYPTVSLGNKLLLRTYDNYHAGFAAKHMAALNRDTEAYANFPDLKEWLANCGAFSEIGRILMFVTERHGVTEPHCDYADRRTRKDQFLWINFRKRKTFYVLDDQFNKHYLTGVINTFDNATWHGSEPSPYAAFSIRVDGKFSESFLQMTGLDEHFARKRNETTR
jgi:hypothetical protein